MSFYTGVATAGYRSNLASPAHLRVICACVCTAVAELNTLRDHVARKAENAICPFAESLLIPLWDSQGRVGYPDTGGPNHLRAGGEFGDYAQNKHC